MEKVYEVEVLKQKNLTLTTENVKIVENIKYIEKHVIDEAIKKHKNPRDRMLIKFLWMTGVRISEATNIKKQDIIWDQDVIIINWLKKRKKITRTIPIHKDLKDALYIYCSPMNLNQRIFPISRIRAYQIIKPIFGEGPHMLRHSFAVNYMNQQGAITELKELLGHKRIDTTMIYSKLTKKDLIDRLNKIEF